MNTINLPFIIYHLPLLIIILLLSSCSTGSQKDLDLQLQQARILSRQGDVYGAIESYKKALGLDPASAKIHVEIAKLERRIGQIDLAIKHLEKAIQLEPGLLDAKIDLGYCYLVSHRYENARTMAKKVLESDPNNILAKILLNDKDALMGDYKKALRRIDSLSRAAPSDFMLLLRKGDLNLLMGKTAEAEKAYRRALQIAPGSEAVLLSWANFCGITGDLKGQETAFKKLLAMDPENLIYFSMLGDFYLEHDQQDKAIALYKKALELPYAKKNFLFLGRAAEVFLYTGHLQLARDIIARLRSLNSKDVAVPYLAGHLALQQGHLEEAIGDFQQSIYYGGACDTVYFYLGVAKWLAGYELQAKSALQQAIKLNPFFVKAWLHLSALDLASGAEDEAEDALARAVYIKPDGIGVHRLYALMLLEKGSVKEFRRQLELLKGLGERPEILDAMELLYPGRSSDLCSRKKIQALDRFPMIERLCLGAPSPVKDVDPVLITARAIDTGKKKIHGPFPRKPETTAELYVTARLALISGELDRAQATLAALKKKAGNKPYVLRLEIAVQKAMGDNAGMIKCYRELLMTQPDDPDVMNNLAWLLSQQDDMESLKEAQSLAEKACDEDSTNPAFQDTLGWIYWKQGMKESAKQAWESAISLAPRNPTIKSHLALLGEAVQE